MVPLVWIAACAAMTSKAHLVELSQEASGQTLSGACTLVAAVVLIAIAASPGQGGVEADKGGGRLRCRESGTAVVRILYTLVPISRQISQQITALPLKITALPLSELFTPLCHRPGAGLVSD
jgi:hypothetical protein